MLQIREERHMLYMNGICFFIQENILRFPAEYFSFKKYSLKNEMYSELTKKTPE